MLDFLKKDKVQAGRCRCGGVIITMPDGKNRCSMCGEESKQ